MKIPYHFIFDVKHDLTRKARLVAGGHKHVDVPAHMVYSSVASRDSVRVCLMLAALNDLEVKTADIGNAYLNAQCREKIWTEAGPEFGSDSGSVMLIEKALYGLKSSGAAWRAMFAATLQYMGYKSTKADPDVWIKPAAKPDGTKYYEMILVYVDDVLHISHDTEPVMKTLGESYRLKSNTHGEPDRYLGANINKVSVGNKVLFSMQCDDYVRSSITNLEQMLRDDGSGKLETYGKRAVTRPFPQTYRPECDVSKELNEDLASRYLQLIGILR